MLVGACRPEENQFHPRPKPSDPAEEHSIQSLWDELTRHYGDIQINLNQANPDEGWAFINALIDSEFNDLDRAFRDTLFRYTHGHPLFSVEMLRHMQANHHLIGDDTGKMDPQPEAQSFPLASPYRGRDRRSAWRCSLPYRGRC